MKTQVGFSQLVLIAIVAVGIVTGAILVQNGVSFLPKAAEQEDLHPSAGKTQECDKLTDEAAKKTCKDKICFDDTVTYCDNRSGEPRAIRKSGGYYDPSDPNQDPASGCVFDYREVSIKNKECSTSESKSGDVVYTTKEDAQKLDSERAKQANQAPGAPGSAASAGSTAVCKDTTTEKAFKDEKVSGNLVRFYSILAGVPEYCTPADLGVGAKLEEKGANGQIGRTMLCSGKDGAITWRVIQGTTLEPAQRQTPTDPDGIKAFLKSYLDKAVEVAK